ncbi:MAG TPA: 30S ribosome-binding factor RbfA [Anaerolineaceae bacterium]|jgi:ribosome-binding factor A|nr:30S ribosome-binding factor RbfA [Anaerolineaceae bacterium]
MPTGIRLKRIQDQILQVITIILETKVNDPRIAGAYVTDVSVDRELDYADIYISSLAGSENADEILEGLRNAAGFIRHALSQEVKLRVMPKLRFFWDNTPERADRLESLFSEIRNEREANGETPVQKQHDNVDEEMNDEEN